MDTSLHIAVCDANPGDRKQMERLLARESDKRASTTGIFYIDSFGGIEAIVKSPLVYDVYFIDSVDPMCDSNLIAHAIRGKGIISPIVYCISTIDFRESDQHFDNSLFIDKPIKVSELSDLLDELIQRKKDCYVPTIELRSNYESFYVVEKDVMYFTRDGAYVTVHLKNGSERKASVFLESLWRDLYAFPTFQLLGKNAIVNTRYAKSAGLMSVTMQDDSKHSVKLKYMPLIKEKIVRFKEK